jgi:hypothetical protein
MVLGQAPGCDSLRPLEGTPYQYRDRGNRCEGLYIAEYGSLKIELVSLTRGAIRFSLRPKEKLLVSATPESGPIHVRAVAKPARTPYRMDTILQPGATLLWPVEDVLLPEGISAARIGVFGWKTDGKERVYVPVYITSEASASERGSSAPVVLSIRPSLDARIVKWRSAARKGETCTPFSEWKDASSAGVEADVAVDIPLEGLQGPLCIQVAAQSTEGPWFTTIPDLKVQFPAR